MEHAFIPVYQKLKDHYTEMIINQDYPPGQKIDSIHQIMIRHKVSRETAKRVLRLLAEEGLIVTRRGKGSFVVQHRETNNTWGMVIPFYTSNMEQLIHCLDEEARKRSKVFNYFLDYNNTDEEKRLVSKMILEGYEAIIIVPNYDETKTAEFYKDLIQGNTQVILIDYTMSGTYFKYVVQSYDLGIRRAVNYLAGGHEGNLLLVKNETWKGRNLLNELMEQTFSTTISLDYPEKEVFVLPMVKQLSKSFIRDNRIRGVLCCSDVESLRVLGRLRNWNIRVPDEVKLVNYGNTELTRLYEPEISVIDCRYEEMAAKTAAIIDHGKGASPYEQHIIQSKLIIRDT
jgi:DNA-binding LacI/PurR family transcriptional regulator